MRNFILIVAAILMGLGARFVTRKFEAPRVVEVVGSEHAKEETKVADAPAASPKTSDAKVERPPAPMLQGVVEDVRPAEPLWVAGIVVQGRKINVLLSDGRIYTERDKELEAVERNSATISGVKIFYRPSSLGKAQETNVASGAEAKTDVKVAKVEDKKTPGIVPAQPVSDGKPRIYRGAIEREALAGMTDAIHR
jgi:hypothetical protein